MSKWIPGEFFKLVCCDKCGSSSLEGEEVELEGDYDFCIQWLCATCGNMVSETKGYNCQFERLGSEEE